MAEPLEWIAIGEAVTALYYAVGTALGLIATGAAVDELSKARERSKAVPKAETKTTEDCPKDPCDAHKKDVDNALNADKGSPESLAKNNGRRTGPHGVKARWQEQIYGKCGPGMLNNEGINVWDVHTNAFLQERAHLRNAILDAIKNGCQHVIPPDAWKWQVQEPPEPGDWVPDPMRGPCE